MLLHTVVVLNTASNSYTQCTNMPEARTPG